MSDQLETLKAALADHYEVEHEIGAGGMATVYIARDPKHDRRVAIKVLHPDLAQSLGAERFLREVQITAKLQHPHILPLFDSGAADGLLYYVMPFVEGESLADRIGREKQIAIKEAVAITKEVAQALGYAHSLGLVHRDIKPANIMLTGGHAIVADFGIARAVDAAGAEKLTQTGMAVGTPAYMSPEQAAGDSQVDRRSDLYSLGCVLYEMLVGQVPFTGPTAMAIMARHSMDNVPPPSIMRDAIPDELEDVLMRALAKTPADRFQTGAEFAEALDALDLLTAVHRRPSGARRQSGVMPRGSARSTRRPAIVAAVAAVGLAAAGAVWWGLLRGRDTMGPATGGLNPKTVAVLYFEDQSQGHQLGFLADGLTEGLIHALSGVPGLDVISSNGVAQFRGSTAPRDSIARALGAGSLIVGSVEPAGERVRVTTRLVDGESGADLDRASLELPATEALTVLDSVSRDVSRILRARLGEEIRLRETRAATRDVEAWTLLQRAERLRKDGRAAVGRDTAAALRTLREADSLAARAAGRDRRWVAPLVLRGWLAYDQARPSFDKQQRVPATRAGLSNAEQALALAPGDATALELRGMLRYELWRLNVTPDPTQQARLLVDAQADLEAAVAADPTRALASYQLSRLHYQRKDNFSAVMAARQAYEADAYLSVANVILDGLFWTHYDLEQFTDATRWCREGARRFPADYRFAGCRLWLLTTPAAPPDIPRAWELSRSLAAAAPPARRDFYDHMGRVIVGGVIGRAGLLDSAKHVLVAARATQETDPQHELEGYEAVMRVLIGDKDEAVALLRRYVAINPGHSFNVDRDLHWWWRPLRDHPGFRAVTAPSPP